VGERMIGRRGGCRWWGEAPERSRVFRGVYGLSGLIVGNAETCAEPRLGPSVDFVPEVDPEPLSTLFIPAFRVEIATSWDQRLGAHADIAHRSVRTNHRRC
jgi:hypothetical protein